MKKALKLISGLFLFVCCLSCGVSKKVPYFVEAETLTKEQLESTAKIYEAKVMPRDLLSISVFTPNAEASATFNMKSVRPGETTTSQFLIDRAEEQYLVDKEGNIDFPVLGKLHLEGMTRLEIQQMIKDQIYPKYLKEEPIVTVRFENYKVTVLGEVKNPGTFTVANEQCSIMDALAMAGDLTIYGKRDNVMLVRENPNGEKNIFRINLQDKDLLLYPSLYYLQQNDMLIVEPNKSKAKQAATVSPMTTFGIGLVSTLISIATFVITLTKL